jgi:hypothetical protein
MLLHGNKLKVLLCFSLIKHHDMKRYERMETWLHTFLTLASSTPGVKVLNTHLIGGWVGPRVGLDTAVKREISATA